MRRKSEKVSKSVIPGKELAEDKEANEAGIRLIGDIHPRPTRSKERTNFLAR